MIGAEISCWDLSRFGLENRRKNSQIFNYDIYLPFFLLFILWYGCSENMIGTGVPVPQHIEQSAV
jgi:hypothetical protein